MDKMTELIVMMKLSNHLLRLSTGASGDPDVKFVEGFCLQDSVGLVKMRLMKTQHEVVETVFRVVLDPGTGVTVVPQSGWFLN